eukprot:TRINITY_DN26201_c0_g1_i2.p1 TRINITY_DN26201_c0_g1~~TRINITY_DN26201_c0_g1_i2.p1  ORF type:complete len:254 (+),score=77.01 TRINITY_DN26201_c0_g1_i2:113-874(+)
MSRRAGALLCLLAVVSLPAEAAKAKTAVRGSWTSSDADSGWWPFSSSESSSQVGSVGTVAAPGEEVFRDEALPIRARAEEAPKKMASSRSSAPARVQSEPIANMAAAQPQARSQAAVVEEYDDTMQSATDGVLNALFDEQPAKAKPQQVGLLEKRSSATLPGLTKPDMKDQCLKFASWAKATGTEGKSLAMLFKSTCVPLAKAGADATFKKMCEELGPKMEEFANDKNWIPAQACDVMVKHFRKSGVGANPLE